MYRFTAGSWSGRRIRRNLLKIMRAVLLDFNGTLFFDTCFHLEAWSEIYREFHKDTDEVPGSSFFCGPRNDDIIQAIAPGLPKVEREKCSERKEALYRAICRKNPDKLHLTAGAEALFQYMQEQRYPYILASASIKANVDFYFETFHLESWFDRDQCVYDDGTYNHKGEMHVEAARRLGADLSECIVVEDSISAIKHAKDNGAGMIVAVGNEAVYPELIRSGANHCIKDFTEFDYEWLRN